MVQVVARRVGARQIEAWTRSEISGYPNRQDLPDYRKPNATVRGLYTGPMQSSVLQTLTVRPPRLEHHWTAWLQQPLAELQALAGSVDEGEPQIAWPAGAVRAYRDSGVFGINMFVLFEVHTVITRQALRGVVDVVRSRALDFALDLQEQFPEAGEKGGPTVATTPALAQTIGSLTVNITGHGTNLGLGATVSQQSSVQVGDRDALRQAATEAGLTDDDAEEFVAAVEEERDPEGPRTRSVLDRVRSGAITAGASIGAGAAGDLLAAAVSQFLGLS